ncbi:MAG: branched-chain amino acid ABC transporter permease [Chloroflexi bacterium]|nr:branched-chain amino acid ABC transporter permease [Chloroflexota bacterium]
MQYYIGVIILICCNIIAVLGLSLLTGFTGIFSFGHAAFMALGAYTAALLTVKLGFPFGLALIFATGVAAIIGYLIGIPTLKLVGDYFAIVMLGVGEATKLILENLINLTGGARGMLGIDTKTSLPIAVSIAVAAILFIRNIINSRYGRNFMAIREDNLAAECCGIDTFWMKKISLTISAAMGGLAGGLFAHYIGYIQPIMFNMDKSTELAAAVVFGGLGSISGSVIATIILTALPELLRPLYEWRLVIYGFLLVATIVLRPQGLMGGKEISLRSLNHLMFRLKMLITNIKKGKKLNGSIKD